MRNVDSRTAGQSLCVGAARYLRAVLRQRLYFLTCRKTPRYSRVLDRGRRDVRQLCPHRLHTTLPQEHRATTPRPGTT
jgi:hypothetical protein